MQSSNDTVQIKDGGYESATPTITGTPRMRKIKPINNSLQ
jgi:hypothetical protein